MTQSSEHNCAENGYQEGVWSDEMATWYVEKWGEHAMHDLVVPLAEIDNTKPQAILDIGCGSGPVVRRVAQYLNEGSVTGVDPTAKMIELAKAKTQKINDITVDYVQTGAEQLPCQNQSIDVVLAVNSFHHWQNVTQGLSEVCRILKPGAKLVLIDELWDEMPEFEKPPGFEDSDAHEDSNEMKNTEVVMTLLEKAGLQNISKRIHRSDAASLSVITAYK